MSFLVSFVLVFFGPFSIAITSLGEERGNLSAFPTFVRLFDLCLFGFVGFLFLLVSGNGCGLWLWHSLAFLLPFFIYGAFIVIICPSSLILLVPSESYVSWLWSSWMTDHFAYYVLSVCFVLIFGAALCHIQKKVKTAYLGIHVGGYYRKCYTCVTKTERGYCFQEFWRLEQGISEPEFYGDLVYRFRKIVGKSNFSEQVRKLIDRYKRIGFSLDIMRQTACLVVNPIIVDGYASLFNCTTAVRASDPMTASS